LQKISVLLSLACTELVSFCRGTPLHAMRLFD